MTHMEFAHPYFGAFVMFIVTFGAFGATVWLSRYISRKIARLDTEKLKTTLYECGPEVTKQPNKISAQFYLWRYFLFYSMLKSYLCFHGQSTLSYWVGLDLLKWFYL